MIGIKDQQFGVEIEMTGLTRRDAAYALAEYFQTRPIYIGGAYDPWVVKDDSGRIWKLMRDSSIRPRQKVGERYMSTTDSDYQVEFVTPILHYEDMPTFQECIRALRKAGGKVNSSCGLHVHVDAANHNRQSLKNLLSIMYSKEDILFKALKVDEGRAQYYCQKTREHMLEKARKLSADETKDLTKLEEIWYDGAGDRYTHYDDTRYHALNLHPGMEAEVKQYLEAVRLLNACGCSREELAAQKEECYTNLADLNREIRAVRKQQKLCREIQTEIPQAQRQINQIEQRKEVNRDDKRR